MTSYNHLYEICLSDANRREAVRMVKRSKRIRKTLKKRHISDDALASYAYDWTVDYKNAHHTPIKIYDGVSRKTRSIIVPTLEELVVQHCIVNALKPMFIKGMYTHSYASIPGRGAHKGKKVIEKWVRKDRHNTKYVLKMDIHHFFDTIPHDILKAKLEKVIRDKRMLKLLFTIIDVTDRGIPLGFYTSQWLSNWYLQELDHFIKEDLHAKYYMRYMDDMVIFGCNKRMLHRMRRKIDEFLGSKLGLSLKGNWQVYRFSHEEEQGRDLDFMGFRFFWNRTILRKSIMYKATRKAAHISKKDRPNTHDARQMLSYLGWLKCTDTYKMYLDWIKPKISFQYLKRRIAKSDKQDGFRTYLSLAKLYCLGGT